MEIAACEIHTFMNVSTVMVKVVKKPGEISWTRTIKNLIHYFYVIFWRFRRRKETRRDNRNCCGPSVLRSTYWKGVHPPESETFRHSNPLFNCYIYKRWSLSRRPSHTWRFFGTPRVGETRLFLDIGTELDVIPFFSPFSSFSHVDRYSL